MWSPIVVTNWMRKQPSLVTSERSLDGVHTDRALDSLQSEVGTTLIAWTLGRYGPQLEAKIVQKKTQRNALGLVQNQ